jgi:hypothetical protein
MGVINFARLVMELNDRSREYRKNHDKDNYIDFLEEVNNELIKEFQEIIKENDELKKQIEETNDNRLKTMHLEILSIANKEEEGISTFSLDKLYEEDQKYKIAFSELQDWDYLLYSHSYGAALMNSRTISYYVINTNKKTEVLKLLSGAGKL